MGKQQKIDSLARLIIAYRAWRDGEEQFAREVLKGAWDHSNRRDIATVRELLNSPMFHATIEDLR